MEASILSAISDLGVGVAAVLALGYVSLRHSQESTQRTEKFLKHIDERTQRHETAMMEREGALRIVEKEIRTQLAETLSKNTTIMERVILHLDRH